MIVAAHGDRGGLRNNRLAVTLAERVAARRHFAHVSVAYLRGEPGLEDVAAACPGVPAYVYPLFMSRGYYVNRAIPERMSLSTDGRDGAGRPVRILEPIGLRPVMADIVAGQAQAAAATAGLASGQAGLLLVAHGSTKAPASRQAALALASRIAVMAAFRRVDCAFLEEPPFLGDVLGQPAGPLIVVGLFIGEGMHGIDDLQRAVAAAARDDLVLVPPLAGWSDLADAACADILAATG